MNLGWKSVEKITLTEFGIGFATKEGGWFIPISALGSATTMETEYEKIVSVMKSSQFVDEMDQSVPRILH